MASTSASKSTSASATSTSELIEGKYTEQHLRSTAKTIVTKKTADSVILDITAEDAVPRFDYNELIVGKVLGRGGFCVVNEITKITIPVTEQTVTSTNPTTNSNNNNNNNINDNDNSEQNDEQAISHIIQDRQFMVKHYLRGKTKDCRYAIKLLHDSNKKDSSTYINGVVDLVIETRFLSVIRHANIIKMRAISNSNPYNPNETYFVILDRLYDTLTIRLTKWKKQQSSSTNRLFQKMILDRSGKKEKAFYIERLSFAYDLACALKYLHDNHIMYRDIKPDNIGFDVRGDIKLFDFGLAKEYTTIIKLQDGMYPNMTGDTGSPRYMDPQVALNKPYNELCDVYSFCILLWEMLELEQPYNGFTMKMLTVKVINGGSRPKINTKDWSIPIQQLLSNGFGSIYQRKSIHNVCEIIRLDLSKECGYEINEYNDISHHGNKDNRIVNSTTTGSSTAAIDRRGMLRKSVLSASDLMKSDC